MADSKFADLKLAALQQAAARRERHQAAKRKHVPTGQTPPSQKMGKGETVDDHTTPGTASSTLPRKLSFSGVQSDMHC